jgi:hypothetical protein
MAFFYLYLFRLDSLLSSRREGEREKGERGREEFLTSHTSRLRRAGNRLQITDHRSKITNSTSQRINTSTHPHIPPGAGRQQSKTLVAFSKNSFFQRPVRLV